MPRWPYQPVPNGPSYQDPLHGLTRTKWHVVLLSLLVAVVLIAFAVDGGIVVLFVAGVWPLAFALAGLNASYWEALGRWRAARMYEKAVEFSMQREEKAAEEEKKTGKWPAWALDRHEGTDLAYSASITAVRTSQRGDVMLPILLVGTPTVTSLAAFFLWNAHWALLVNASVIPVLILWGLARSRLRSR